MCLNNSVKPSYLILERAKKKEIKISKDLIYWYSSRINNIGKQRYGITFLTTQYLTTLYYLNKAILRTGCKHLAIVGEADMKNLVGVLFDDGSFHCWGVVIQSFKLLQPGGFAWSNPNAPRNTIILIEMLSPQLFIKRNFIHSPEIEKNWNDNLNDIDRYFKNFQGN